MKNEAMNAINFGIVESLLFANEMKPTKCLAKEKKLKQGQESKKRKKKKKASMERNRKEKVKTVASLLNSKTISKFYFLRMSELWTNILHQDLKVMKCTNCKELFGKF